MKFIKGTAVFETLDEIVDPKHTALVVVDVQNDNSSLRGVLASKGKDISWARKTLPNIHKVLEEARRLGLVIVFTRNTRSKDGSHESGPMYRKHLTSAHPAESVGSYEEEGTWGNEVLDELEPRPNERQIIKYRSSSFMGTPLDLIFKNRGIKSAVIVGLVTQGCVEATVRDAEQYGYYPVVLRDCVCSHTPALQEASLLVMAAKWDATTSEELLRIWRGHPRFEAYQARTAGAADKLPGKS